MAQQSQRPTDRTARPQHSPARTTHGQLTLAGAVLALVGTFLPWVSTSAFGMTASRTGLDGIGVAVFALCLLAVGVVLLTDWRDLRVLLTLACGACSALIAGYVLYGISLASGRTAAVVSAMASPGIGLYASLAGSLVLAGGAWWRRRWLHQHSNPVRQNSPSATRAQQPGQQRSRQTQHQQPGRSGGE